MLKFHSTFNPQRVRAVAVRSPAGILRRTMQYFAPLVVALVAWLGAASGGVANHAHAAEADTPPPARVGRISFLEGDVSFFGDRTEGWQKARMNFPVTSRNSVWVNGDGRAELRVGASAFRVFDNSVLDIAVLDDARTQLFLQRGMLQLRLRNYTGNEDYRDQFRLETPDVTLRLAFGGRYRVEAVEGRNETIVHVFGGRADIESNVARLSVEPGKSLTVRMIAGQPAYAFGVAREDAADRWADSRDRRWDDTHQRYAMDQRVSPYMTGYEDLDQYGDWIQDGEYGRLWAPRVVAAGWVPYRYGTWSYVRPWGWTWVDNAPWGFAPFHYGRWVYVRARWCWWPGAYVARPVYAPALVGWHHNGSRHGRGTSVSVGVGLGWFPLAPREHYVPSYSNNITYIRNINNVTNNVTVVQPTRYINQPVATTTANNGASGPTGMAVAGEPAWPTATIGNGYNQTRQVKPAVDPHVAGPAAGASYAPQAGLSAPVPAMPSANTAIVRSNAAPTAIAGEPIRSQSFPPAPTATSNPPAPPLSATSPRVSGEAMNAGAPTAPPRAIRGEPVFSAPAPAASSAPPPPAYARSNAANPVPAPAAAATLTPPPAPAYAKPAPSASATIGAAAGGNTAASGGAVQGDWRRNTIERERAGQDARPSREPQAAPRVRGERHERNERGQDKPGLDNGGGGNGGSSAGGKVGQARTSQQ
jgi:hypothetical protein